MSRLAKISDHFASTFEQHVKPLLSHSWVRKLPHGVNQRTAWLVMGRQITQNCIDESPAADTQVQKDWMFLFDNGKSCLQRCALSHDLALHCLWSAVAGLFLRCRIPPIGYLQCHEGIPKTTILQWTVYSCILSKAFYVNNLASPTSSVWEMPRGHDAGSQRANLQARRRERWLYGAIHR